MTDAECEEGIRKNEGPVSWDAMAFLLFRLDSARAEVWEEAAGEAAYMGQDRLAGIFRAKAKGAMEGL